MKKHAIIPIFIPHEGCPHDCVFCNQNKITAKTEPVSPDDIHQIIGTHLETLLVNKIQTIEVAFFGGSFTAIPIELQSKYLSIAKEYKDLGKIHKIHLSTRPDYINEKILNNLKKYSVDVIELGVQSFSEDVLKHSNRGHCTDIIYSSCDLIKSYGFELGIQLMIGLPHDTKEKSIFSALETVKIKPSIARIYPTVVIAETKLMEYYDKGTYTPLSHSDAIDTAKEMYKILNKSGINIIRVGLKSSDIMNDSNNVAGNTFHPAFRQLVESEIAKEIIEEKLLITLGESKLTSEITKINFYSNGNSFSNMIGHSKSNKIYFSNKYKNLNIKYCIDSNLADYHYNVVKC